MLRLPYRITWAGALVALVGCVAPLHAVVIPTNESIFVYDTTGQTSFRGAPVAIGAVIDAYDPDGVHCGTRTLSASGPGPGSFAAMAVYKDAPGDPDEGASWGDTVTFRINDVPAQVVRNGPVIWNGNGSTYDISLHVPYITLEFSTEPAGSVSGQPLTTPPVVRALSDGSLDESVTDVFTLTLASGSGTLSGTLTAAAADGVATFGDVIYTAAVDGESFSLQVDDQAGAGEDFAPASSSTVTANVLATQLIFSTQPAGSVSGSALSTQPVVAAVDGALTIDADFASVVGLSTGSPGTLTATPTAATDGQATFADIVYTATADGEAFSLQADGGGLTGASATAASDVVATQLAFASQPSGSVSGTTLTTQPVVEAVDADGHLDTDFGGLVTPTTSAAGTLTGTARSAVAGQVATFDDLEYTATADREPFTIEVSGGGLSGSSAPVTSDVIATHLVFTTQPDGSVSGITLSTQPVIAAVDGALTLDLDFTALVVLTTDAAGSLAASPVATVEGEAAFADVVYSATGDGEAFALQADGGDLSGASAASISDVLATQLVFAVQPSGSVNTMPLAIQPVVEARDDAALLDTDFSERVTLTATATTGGGILSGDVDVTAQAGVATFLTVQYDVDSTGDTFFLTADDEDGAGSNLPPVSSNGIGGTGPHLLFQTQPDGAVSGSALATQPVVIADLAGTDATYSGNVTLGLASGSGELSGDLTRAAIAGVVSFTDVAYTAAVDGEAFSLHAVDEGGTYADAVSGPAASDVVATQLVFSTQPTGSVSGITLSAQPVVAAVDGDLAVDTDFTAPVTLTTTAPGALVATPAAAAAGQAAFVNVAYTATADGEAFTLEAEGGGLTGASLSAVSDVVATQLVYTTQPGRAYNGGPMLTQPVLTAQDSDHATDTDFTEAIALAATVVTGAGLLSGGVTVDAAAGVATFEAVQFDVDSTGDTFFLTANDQDELGSDLPTVTSVTLAGAETGFIVPLSAGYNLVSVGDASGSDPIAIVTQSLGANLVRVLGFETPAINPNPPITGGKLYDPSLPAGVNTLLWTDPRLAYWLQVSEDDTLIIGGAMGKAMASAQPGSAEPPEHTVGSLHPVYDFMGIHGVLTVEGQPAPPGTTVEVVDTEGNLAGQVAVHHSGYYGFMPIYRDDPRSAVDEGADRGEWLHVRVNGLPTGERVQWTVFGDVVELDLCVSTGVPGFPTTFPRSFALQQNRPNPFNPTTTLSYQLPGEELVSLAIHSLSGQMVRQLVHEKQGRGAYTVMWDGRDDAHLPVASGLYLCTLRAGGLHQTRKLLLLR